MRLTILVPTLEILLHKISGKQNLGLCLVLNLELLFRERSWNPSPGLFSALIWDLINLWTKSKYGTLVVERATNFVTSIHQQLSFRPGLSTFMTSRTGRCHYEMEKTSERTMLTKTQHPHFRQIHQLI